MTFFFFFFFPRVFLLHRSSRHRPCVVPSIAIQFANHKIWGYDSVCVHLVETPRSRNPSPRLTQAQISSLASSFPLLIITHTRSLLARLFLSYLTGRRHLGNAHRPSHVHRSFAAYSLAQNTTRHQRYDGKKPEGWVAGRPGRSGFLLI